MAVTNANIAGSRCIVNEIFVSLVDERGNITLPSVEFKGNYVLGCSISSKTGLTTTSSQTSFSQMEALDTLPQLKGANRAGILLGNTYEKKNGFYLPKVEIAGEFETHNFCTTSTRTFHNLIRMLPRSL